VITLVTAACLLTLPWALGRIAAVAAVTAQTVLSGGLLLDLAQEWTGRSGYSALPAAVDLAGLPAPGLVVAGLVVTVAAGLAEWWPAYGGRPPTAVTTEPQREQPTALSAPTPTPSRPPDAARAADLGADRTARQAQDATGDQCAGRASDGGTFVSMSPVAASNWD